MKKEKKTNAARFLDNHKADYELIPYTVDEKDLSATTVAGKLGEDIRQVYKTLVLRGNTTGVFICVIPGNEELNLKKAAQVSGNKHAEMVAMKELMPLTGYVRGGCSPLGMKKDYPVYIDESCLQFSKIYISAGKRGLQLYLSPKKLIDLCHAQCVNLILSIIK